MGASGNQGCWDQGIEVIEGIADRDLGYLIPSFLDLPFSRLPAS
jgi:hypothetical protein